MRERPSAQQASACEGLTAAVLLQAVPCAPNSQRRARTPGGFTAASHYAGSGAEWFRILRKGSSGKRIVTRLPVCGSRTDNRGSAMSDCLHCEINQLVQQHIERGADLGELAAMMVESLADLILLVPDEDQADLIAHAVSAFGEMFLDKSGAVEGGSSATH